jgi:hypothetical protein
MTCHICTNPAPFFAEGKVLDKYSIAYYKCEKCGFVQTEDPYWLDEAYSDAINRCDVGLVSRNIDLSRKTTATILSFFNPEGKFVDYGGGYGLFVRLMRDAGFNFYRYDKYCENIFAKDFEAEAVGDGGCELVSAFEIFEHLANPLDDIERMLKFSRNLLFTTEILPLSNPKPGDWYYYIQEYGQHISFYTLNSLYAVAERFSLNLYSDGKFFHLLTDKKISHPIFKILTRKNFSFAISAMSRRKSLASNDYREVSKGSRQAR